MLLPRSMLDFHIELTQFDEQEKAFHELRNAMVRAPVLALPNATDPFILDTDASDKSVGAELWFPPGILDKASAFACFFPGLCWISILN
jgi:hypothetical protein